MRGLGSRHLGVAVLLLSSALGSGAARAAGPEGIDPFLEFEQKELLPSDLVPIAGGSSPGGAYVSNPGNGYSLGFEGLSQYYNASVGRNFIPPDTMGAIGKTQFVQTTNGAVGIFSKSGGLVSAQSDTAFWNAAGLSGTPNGDTRVLYSKQYDRWIAVAFAPAVGAGIPNLQIAVSTTSDATGTWKGVRYTQPVGTNAVTGNPYFSPIADYPTLAMDNNAVYIGTNNFAALNSPSGAQNFRGTTLAVLSATDLFAGTPSVTGSAFVTPYVSYAAYANDFSRGYAIQGVNKTSGGDGHIVAVSLTNYGVTRYNVNNPGTGTASLTAATDGIANNAYDSNGPARQPGGYNGQPSRVIDTSDDRVGASAWEVDGRIYLVHTVTPVGSDHTAVRYMVIDAATNAVLDEHDISDPDYDYYQGSIAVNDRGQVVISYNRSGLDAQTGRISILARYYTTTVNGQLYQRGSEFLLKTSDTDQYQNGATFGNPPAGRQRWGDYSATTVDPTDETSFWLIGEFAREYNNAAGGHVGGTGGSRWGQWIANINVGGAVPEPSTWALLIAGFGIVGAVQRRRRSVAA